MKKNIDFPQQATALEFQEEDQITITSEINEDKVSELEVKINELELKLENKDKEMAEQKRKLEIHLTERVKEAERRLTEKKQFIANNYFSKSVGTCAYVSGHLDDLLILHEKLAKIKEEEKLFRSEVAKGRRR